VGFVLDDLAVSLTAVKAGADTTQGLGSRFWEQLTGRKFIYCKIVAAGPDIVFGDAVCWFSSTGARSATVTTSNDVGASGSRFCGVAVNKAATASAGQKLWVMHEGFLGEMSTSKIADTIYARCSTDCNQHAKLMANVRSKGVQSANVTATSLQMYSVIGVAFIDDTSKKLTEGFIRSNVV